MPKKRLLLVLDEAQVLAMSQHADLAHSLRAALDSRKLNIKVVFAGSSEATLRRMFGRYKEPFYNWAPLEPFELLGEDFVQAMLVQVKTLSRFPLSSKEGLAAYDALKRTPEYFRRYLDRYLAYATEGSQAAVDYTLSHVFNDEEFRAAWRSLSPMDRHLLKQIAAGVTELFSQDARLAMAKLSGETAPVGAHVPQNALKRLQAAELIIQFERGEYRMLDDTFGEWVNRHVETQH